MLDRLLGYRKYFKVHTELRLQTNHKIAVSMQNGQLLKHENSSPGGISARSYSNGVFGFASLPSDSDEAIRQVIADADSYVKLFEDKPQRGNKPLMPSPPVCGIFDPFKKEKRLSANEQVDILRQLNEHLTKTYPDLVHVELGLNYLGEEKTLVTSERTQTYSYIPQSNMSVVLAIPANEGVAAIQYPFGTAGELEDVFSDTSVYHAQLDELYRDLRGKANGVHVEAGIHDVVLAPNMAGILAHEAIGHTCEADLVMAGSIAGKNLNKKVASEKITLIDYAHEGPAGGKVPVPMHVDDEGTPCCDAVIIENGVLKDYLTDKRSAGIFNLQPNGNARASNFNDEPIIRMRNTAIKPGDDSFDEMIASVENGYYLKHTSNGEADLTSEFTFSVSCGYEIKNGKIGSPIRETTVSGIGFDMLKTVTHVGDEMQWAGGGMCGKKQGIRVGIGGPSLKCKMKLGGR